MAATSSVHDSVGVRAAADHADDRGTGCQVSVSADLASGQADDLIFLAGHGEQDGTWTNDMIVETLGC